MRKLKLITAAMAGTICFILIATTVRAGVASVNITVNPQKIPINETVEITLSSIGDNVIQYIRVIDELGNIYVNNVVPDKALGDRETYKVSFGPGVSGWINPWGNPGADTSLTGEYDVAVNFYDAFKADAFEIIPPSVPDFSVTFATTTAIGFAIITAQRKFNKK